MSHNPASTRLVPAERLSAINSLIADLGALPEYRVPEASACAGTLQVLAFEGFDLGDPGLRPAQGLASVA